MAWCSPLFIFDRFLPFSRQMFEMRCLEMFALSVCDCASVLVYVRVYVIDTRYPPRYTSFVGKINTRRRRTWTARLLFKALVQGWKFPHRFCISLGIFQTHTLCRKNSHFFFRSAFVIPALFLFASFSQLLTSLPRKMLHAMLWPHLSLRIFFLFEGGETRKNSMGAGKWGAGVEWLTGWMTDWLGAWSAGGRELRVKKLFRGYPVFP